MKNNLEEAWKGEFDRFYYDSCLKVLTTAKFEDLETCYIEGRKKSQDEIESLRTHLLDQCKISKELLTEKEQLEQELKKTREQLEKSENVLNEIYDDGCADDSKNYCHKWFRAVSKYLNSKQDKDKQGE